MMQRFVEEEFMPDPLPRHAQLLGLGSSHTRHHLAPNLYLEMFYRTLVDFLGRSAFHHLSEESIAKMKERQSPYSVGTLMALEAALRSILPRYIETLEVWLLRRSGTAFRSELVLDFIDHVIRPFAVLSAAKIDITKLQTPVEAALAYFGERGNAAAKAVADLVASELDRPLYFDTPDFSYRMIQVINGFTAAD